MVYMVLAVLGLCFGSFINAFVWRLHERRNWVHERSECVHCHHELAAKDLVPIFSWLWLKGRCRYCHKPISAQYPLVEALTTLLFMVSYIFWPLEVAGSETILFGLWLVLLVGLVALLVYDLKWMLLPNKIIFPLFIIAGPQALTRVAIHPSHVQGLVGELLGVLIGGGIFYLLFQISGGRWIGGGDVKLGFLLGLIVGSGEKSLLVIFLAAILGSLVSIPLLAVKRLKRTSTIPFGPFLIIAAIAVVLFGDSIVQWYNHTFLLIG
jgi:prepilin signal peptidase PulO-like enzyme (type II secretory pathway)